MKTTCADIVGILQMRRPGTSELAIPSERAQPTPRVFQSQRLLSLAALLSIASSCASPTTPYPITTALGFGGPQESEPYHIVFGRDAIVRERGSQILVGRSGTVPIELHGVDPEAEAPRDEKQAHRLAGIAQWTIVTELGISDQLGLTVIVCPVPDLRATRIDAELPAASGMAFGVPSIAGEIHKEHASSFVFGLTHEYVEHFLTDPYVEGLRLVHRDPRCQWIADGIAGIVATKALAASLRDKQALVELAPVGYIAITEGELAQGRKEVRLGDKSDSEAGLSGRERIVRQAVAEYLCFRWYTGAQKRGHARPISALIPVLKELPYGPTYETMGDWMRRTSGVDPTKEAESVSLEAVHAYHRANWLNLGWKVEQKP